MKKLSPAVFLLALLAAGAAFSDTTYPQIDISGYKKWEHKRVEVEPQRNLYAGLSQLGGFYPTFTGGPWQERLQLKILGQLSENLAVTYDLEQQPETPEKFDVKVKYYNSELTFGDLNANFSGNEFVSASKFLNGVMLTAKDSWYDIVAVPSGKLKSQTQALTAQKGNNTRGPYNLGHGSIVEGSERIQLNGYFLARNRDYTLDYFEGKITFSRILSQTDEFKYSYEYTNILDLFFPTLSKRDFLGFQSRFIINPDEFGKSAPKEEPVIAAAREIFPTAGTPEPEVQEEEASGRYRLGSAPLLNFSETLKFMGTQLKKNEDYIIRYDTGEIKLLTRFLPTSEEALAVEYKYFQVSAEAETIAGIGSRGPYHTLRREIVPESERVEVDGKLFVRDLDYSIKYGEGVLFFGISINSTSQIKISYRYNVLALPPAAAPKFPKELKIGATYLRETAKKGVGSPTASAIELFTGQALQTANYLINLKNRPLVPTTEAALTVRLKRAGVTRELTAEAEYTFPTSINQLAYLTDRSDPTDGLAAGTILLLNQNLNIVPSDEVTVAYTYKKSIVGKYSGAGNGSRGPYYIRNFREIVPGSETLQVWDQGSPVIVTFTRNASVDGNAGDTGYSFNYSKENPSITFNKELAPSKSFQAIFQYVPPSTTGGGDISQSAFGLDGNFKIGDVFKVDSSYARSETDQIFFAETTVESFAGNNTKNYVLHSPADIIESSEKIFVNQRLLNRDIDYFITYTKPGQFNFFYITPGTLDAISIEYNFQSLAGIEVGAKVKADSAFRLGAETKIFGDVLTLSGNTKKIGFDFSPLGGTAIGIGSEYEEYNLNFKPEFQSFFSSYSYKMNQNPIGASRRTFLRSYDNAVSAGINPGGKVKIDFGYRNFSTLDDPLSAGALHNSDNLQDAYSASLVPASWQRGVFTLDQKYDFRRTVSQADTVDRGAARSTTSADYYHSGGNLKFTDRVGLGYDFQFNEPRQLGSLETVAAHSISIDNSYNVSVDLTTLFLQKWTARVAILTHDDIRKIPAPEATTSTRNETYHMDLAPFPMLTSALDHTRQEKFSYVVGSENPLSLNTAASTRLSPLPWFSVGANASRTETVPETGSRNKTTGRTTAGDIDYTPISLGAVKLTSRFAASETRQAAPSGAGQVVTNTNALSQSYTLNLTPIPIFPLTVGFSSEDYKNTNNAAANPVRTDTRNQVLNVSASLSFPRLPQLSLSGDYTKKRILDKITGNRPEKNVTNAKVNYQFLGWGTIIYDISKEDNKGDIQSGILVPLNIEKTTQAISINITMPINSPVLSNFVALASLKQVDYKNNNNSSDDFKARLLSFEGTMNF